MAYGMRPYIVRGSLECHLNPTPQRHGSPSAPPNVAAGGFAAGHSTREPHRKDSSMKRLEGKVAYITGVARGQGRSHAIRLAEEGADIIGIDVCSEIQTVPYPGATEADLAETVKLVEDLGRRMVAHHADVRDVDSLRAAADDGL